MSTDSQSFKSKVKNVLGVDTDNDETILQYIETLVSENERLENIEDKKVQIEYDLVYNKGKESAQKEIKRLQEILKEYNITSETMYDGSAISKCCRNKLKTTGGFTWKYAE